MPRNVSGVFSLVAGNPVVTGTSISSSWANNTLNDVSVEMTDSLSRSGKGGMLVPLKVANGTVVAPAFSFTNNPTSGLYAAGANDIRITVNGVDRMLWDLTAVTAKLPVIVNMPLPSISLTSDTEVDNKNIWFRSSGGVEGGLVHEAGAGMVLNTYTANHTELASQIALKENGDAAIYSGGVNGNPADEHLALSGASGVQSAFFGGEILLGNSGTKNAYLSFKKSDGTNFAVMQMFSDDKVYLDSPVDIRFRTNGSTNALTLDTAGKATVVGTCEAGTGFVAKLVPTVVAGDGVLGGSAFYGGILKGQGTGYDVAIQNKNGNNVLIVPTGSANIHTAGDVRVPSGRGIEFSPYGTAATLKAYQEGLWTPSTSGAATAANSVFTKVGRLVTITTTLSGMSTSGGTIIVANLPYVPNSTAYSSFPILCQNIGRANLWSISGWLNASNGQISFWATADGVQDGAAWAQLTYNDVGSGGTITFTASYQAVS